jgi:hypothetical protein
MQDVCAALDGAGYIRAAVQVGDGEKCRGHAIAVAPASGAPGQCAGWWTARATNACADGWPARRWRARSAC